MYFLQLLRAQAWRLEPEGHNGQNLGSSQIDVFLVSLSAVDPQCEPKLERVHASRPLRADARIVDAFGLGRFWHVWSRDGKSALQHFGMASQNYAGGEWHRQPLVGIDCD